MLYRKVLRMSFPPIGVLWRASRQGEALHRIKPAFGGASREISF
ncbi:MAG: hypothetical protein NTX52_09660 [Planctomycetota bacterium]|nr:hypothetical protein [Planctomycetota bacterium]